LDEEEELEREEKGLLIGGCWMGGWRNGNGAHGHVLHSTVTFLLHVAPNLSELSEGVEVGDPKSHSTCTTKFLI
jgi:hypothetical protein